MTSPAENAAIAAGSPRHGIDLVSGEIEQVVRGFNRTSTEYPIGVPLSTLFEECAARWPENVAVFAGNTSLSYAELNQRANQLASYLRENGVAAADCVPICIERSVAMVIAQLAVLKAGGIYVPIDPAQPPERQAFMIRDCGARHVLTSRESARAIDASLAQVIKYERFAEQVDRLPTHNSVFDGAAPEAAYVMYTSGSTGQPKGVLVPHSGVSRLAINNGYADITSADCVAHCSNPAFDASTFEIWAALLTGARLCVLPPEIVLDTARLEAALEKLQISVLFLTTALFNRHAAENPRMFSRLRYLLFGGEAANAALARRVLESQPPRHICNVYGPTEATAFATFWPVTHVDEGDVTLPIGRPIANTRIYILDEQRRPQLIGDAGELYIGGPGVACGYLNQPQLTAERFIPDPFGASASERLYRTGDLGRWLPDGSIEFLGRNDDQVKIRGFRIELGEIAAHLATCDGVCEATVVAQSDGPGDRRLAAYVTTAKGVTLSASQMREYMAASLPDYMIPSAYVVLDKLPLNANGKVDRAALPAPDDSSVVRREFEPPQGEIEEFVASVWQESLRLSELGRHDNFFELGGNSLMGMDVVAKIAEHFDVELNFLTIFQAPTVSQVSARVAESLCTQAVK